MPGNGGSGGAGGGGPVPGGPLGSRNDPIYTTPTRQERFDSLDVRPFLGDTDEPAFDTAGRRDQEKVTAGINAALKSYSAGKRAYDDFVKAVEADLMGHAENYARIHAQLGGYVDHQELADTGQTTMKMAIKRYDIIASMHGQRTDEFIAEMQQAGHEITQAEAERLKSVDTSYLTRYYKDQTEANNQQSEILSQLIMQNAEAVNQLDMTTISKLPAYVDAMGLAHEDVAKMMERSIVLTGKASTESIDKVSAYALEVSEATGIAIKPIQDITIDIMGNIEQFGFITEEAAIKIATNVQQMGVRFDTLKGQLTGFQEFSGAADIAGQISQLTAGAVQLDAQELMYLASEEQEKFLPELKKMFEDSGFDADAFRNMTNADRRALSQSIKMDQAEFINFLEAKPGEDLDSIMKKAKDEGKLEEDKAFGTVKAQYQATRNAIRTTQDLMDQARKEALEKNRHFATQVVDDMGDIAKAQQEMFKPPAPDFMTEYELAADQIAGFAEKSRELSKVFNFDPNDLQEGVDLFTAKVVPMAEGAGSAISDGIKGPLSMFLPESVPPIWKKVTEGITFWGKDGKTAEALMGAGESLANSLKQGFDNAGIDMAQFSKEIDAIAKSQPVMIQKNIETLVKNLESTKKLTEDRYQETFDDVIENLSKINEAIQALQAAQGSITEAILKEKNISMELNGNELLKAIIAEAPYAENAGVKLVTER